LIILEDVSATKDKLKAVHSIFDKFSQACIEDYSSHSHSTADERLATYRERNPFTAYIKGNQVRYGLKVWVCTGTVTTYVLKLPSTHWQG